MMQRRPLDWGWALGVPMAMVGLASAWGAGVFALSANYTESGGLAMLSLVFGGIGGLWLVTSYRANRYTIHPRSESAHGPRLEERDCPPRWPRDTAARQRARIDLPVPPDGVESNDDDPNNETIWRLLVSADVGGRQYASVFDVPVFRG